MHRIVCHGTPVRAIWMAMGLLYRLHNMVKCVLYGGFGSNSFVTKVQPFPLDGHYKTYIISGMRHSRSDSVVPLVLCMIACNGWGTDIILQVPRESPNPVEKR